jgi:D-alanyl-D-alanine carboxypeptidase/D-alanyl-D-alanine-endopeptidase (penicillin-binding protein 4)
MFVAGGQAGYMTTASGKDAAAVVYALNGVYPNVADGLAPPGGVLPNTEKVLTEMQLHG